MISEIIQFRLLLKNIMFCPLWAGSLHDKDQLRSSGSTSQDPCPPPVPTGPPSPLHTPLSPAWPPGCLASLSQNTADSFANLFSSVCTY